MASKSAQIGGVIAGLLVLAVGPRTYAYYAGIHGYSGEQGAICNSCHVGGATPSVTIEGPPALSVGQQGWYRLTIEGGSAVVGGLDLSADDPAAALSPGPGTQSLAGEVTHLAPKAFANGAASFCVLLTAPPSPGTVTLYGAGNSANGDDTPMGDAAASSTFAVQVVATPASGVAGSCSEADPLPVAAGCSAVPSRSTDPFVPVAALTGLLLWRSRRSRHLTTNHSGGSSCNG